jgi:hypothetical protein
MYCTGWALKSDLGGPVCNACYQSLNRIAKQLPLKEKTNMLRAYLKEMSESEPMSFAQVVAQAASQPVSSQPIEQSFALPTLHHAGAPTMQKKRKTMCTESHVPAHVYAEASLPHDIPMLQHHVPRGYAHFTSFASMHPEPQYNLPQYNLSQYNLPPLQSERK